MRDAELLEPLNPLQAEDAAEAADARHRRSRFERSKFGPFTRKLDGVMGEYLAARKQGLGRDICVNGLLEFIKSDWPMPLTKFLPDCEECQDSGRRVMTCWDQQRCGRKRCALQHPSFEHSYVVPCDCVKGDRFRPRTYAADDQLEAVGKPSKPKKKSTWKRMGQ
jgi:hypothetical protein